ncbi:uncharacterized protein LOC122663381 [Telopea speciosissima]|uniref:uncharacterized protein LOC122663381 n=1 Tax=Telopea speciosissima TaxID=54955 RepID=UPI001CC4D511|nr:uncharacterized protein LOC122663381 [Telopea speciosissima]
MNTGVKQGRIMSQDDSTQPPGSEDWTQEDSGATTPVRRGRGKRGKTMAKDIVNMPSGEKICIGVNKYGQANSTRTAKIATWIGLLAKNTDLLPLTYPDWRKEKFDIPESSRSWILEKLCARWGDYKSLLKSEHFNKYETDSEQGSYFQPLSWNLRMKVALDAAKGLAFLHSAETKDIYRDFKASNILLDSSYNAKLSDFGLAKDGPTGDKSHVSTRVMGTYGYAAPEYLATAVDALIIKVLTRKIELLCNDLVLSIKASIYFSLLVCAPPEQDKTETQALEGSSKVPILVQIITMAWMVECSQFHLLMMENFISKQVYLLRRPWPRTRDNQIQRQHQVEEVKTNWFYSEVNFYATKNIWKLYFTKFEHGNGKLSD